MLNFKVVFWIGLLFVFDRHAAQASSIILSSFGGVGNCQVVNGVPYVTSAGVLTCDPTKISFTPSTSTLALSTTSTLAVAASDGSIDLLVVNTVNGSNVMSLKSTSNSGYSAVRMLDLNGIETCALGYGNPGSGSTFGGTGFLECSTKILSAAYPGMKFVSTFNDGVPRTIIRANLETDGTATFNGYASGASTTVVTTLLLGNSAVTLTGNTTLVGTWTAKVGSTTYMTSSTSGTAIVKNDLTITDAANTGGHICLFDCNSGIYGREGGVDHQNYYTFGGTLAAGKGHQFYTGGVKASQTVKLQVADDGIAVASVIGFPSGTIGASALDTGFSRTSPGIAEINNGTPGTLKNLRLGYVQTVPVATSTLVACAAGTAGARAAVNDALAPAVGVALTGGGTIFATVHCSSTTNSYIVDGL